MRRGLVIGLFLCVASIQVITSLSMVIKRESVLKTGIRFKFKTAPVDPYDAFRGRYVALRIEEDKAPLPAGEHLKYGQKVYAHIIVDGEGFAKFSGVTTGRPRQGAAYIEAKVGYISGGKATLDLPIDRYYMEEAAAPIAEKIYLQQTGGSRRDAYVLVRIRDGFAVIESLYVGGKRIEEAVKSTE